MMGDLRDSAGRLFQVQDYNPLLPETNFQNYCSIVATTVCVNIHMYIQYIVVSRPFAKAFATLWRPFATAASKTHVHISSCDSVTKSVTWVLEIWQTVQQCAAATSTKSQTS